MAVWTESVTYNRHVKSFIILVDLIQSNHYFLFNKLIGDSPKHADEEIWSSGSSSSPLSLHLFFNLSAIQSQTRHGFQLYVIGAKLRLLKFAEVKLNQFYLRETNLFI